MKNKLALTSMLASAVLAFVPIVAHANPIGVNADIYCPSTQGSNNVVVNFGEYIAGYGVESMLSQNIQIYFKSETLADNVPHKLTNYYNESVNYNSATGKVTCSYVSNIPAEPRFLVSYVITNGKGGAVQWQNSNGISLVFPLGFRA